MLLETTKSLSVFMAMGGYAVYVWPTYALVLAVFAGQGLRACWRLRRFFQERQDA